MGCLFLGDTEHVLVQSKMGTGKDGVVFHW
jgi:hypothetical protein